MAGAGGGCQRGGPAWGCSPALSAAAGAGAAAGSWQLAAAVSRPTGSETARSPLEAHTLLAAAAAAAAAAAGLRPVLLQGLVRSIGVSNFGIPHLQKLMQTAAIKPVVNQIELHPWLQWRGEVAYCQQEGIALEVRCGTCCLLNLLSS